MKKYIALFLSLSVLILAGCGKEDTSNNENQNSTIPLFIEQLNNNTPVVNQNQNGNTEETSNMNQNENRNGNTQQNQNSTSDSRSTEIQGTVDLSQYLPHETTFKCQALNVYKTMDFYPDFLEKFQSQPRYSDMEIRVKIQRTPSDEQKQNFAKSGQAEKEQETNITSACLADDKSIFIVISEGDTQGYGFKIAQYQPYRKMLQIAQREDLLNGTVWTVTPLQFGKRTATTMSLSADFVSQERAESLDLTYDYVNNFIKSGQHCLLVKGSSRTCGAYNYTKK